MRNKRVKILRKQAEDEMIGASDAVTRRYYKKLKSGYKVKKRSQKTQPKLRQSRRQTRLAA